jgi:CO/xanthine dehydrogenase FAD-binding subunit
VRRFELVLPESVEACVKALAQGGGESRVIAGGTDLVPQMKNGVLKPARVIDLSGIPRLRAIEAGNGRGSGSAPR